MAFDWNDPEKIRQAREKAIQVGYKPKDVDAFIASKQKASATLDLGRQGVVDVSKIAETDPIGALQLSKEGVTPQLNETQQKSADVKKELSSKAQDLLTVLDAGKEGKLKGKAYKDALNASAAKFAASSGFGEGGKALTGPELAILAGSMPRIKEVKQNFIQKLLGQDIAQSGELVDDEATLRRKALIAIKGLNSESIGELQNTSDNQETSGIVQNAGQDVKGILNGVLGLPRGIFDIAKKDFQQQNQKSGINRLLGLSNLPNQIQTEVGFNMAKNTFGEYNNALGQPLEGGDIVGRAVTHAQQHPVNTAIDLLPFLKAAQSAKSTKAASVTSGVNTTQPLMDVLGGTGNKMRANIRKIDVGPSVYGPSKEATINNTLNKLGIKGSADQQYQQLQPTMAKLGDEIKIELEQNPKTVRIDDIVKDFHTNLEHEIRSKNLSTKKAKTEISGYLSDLYGEDLKESIATSDLFDMKQKINQDYGSIKNKLERGTPLNDREKVIAVARQTLDDIIAKEHPNVKKATLAQSNLYDAADSLYKSRKKNIGLRLMGNQIPLPTQRIQQSQDLIGRLLGGR